VVIKDFIIRHLRLASYKWPDRTIAKNKARISRGQYQCNICKEIFHYKEIQLDHIKPIIDPLTGWIDFNSFIKRLFCSAEGFQVLCRGCHAEKTQKENRLRKENHKLS